MSEDGRRLKMIGAAIHEIIGRKEHRSEKLGGSTFTEIVYACEYGRARVHATV